MAGAEEQGPRSQAGRPSGGSCVMDRSWRPHAMRWRSFNASVLATNEYQSFVVQRAASNRASWLLSLTRGRPWTAPILRSCRSIRLQPP